MKNLAMIVNRSFKLKVKNVEAMLSPFIAEPIVKGYGPSLRATAHHKQEP